MGSYAGELVGLYILDSLCKEFGKQNLGLYKDDNPACFNRTPGTGLEQIEKKICNVFVATL